jgi:hypothetical protein
MLLAPETPDRKKKWTPSPRLPRTLAGRRLADRHHLPTSLADLIAHLAGFREAL